MPKLYKILIIGLVSTIFFYIVATKIVAFFVDSKYNTVASPPPYKTTPQARALYYNLPFVADLHSDVLLWNRNIEKRHKYGHEDIPRMIDANLALQAFTIVSKTPKNLNFDHNDDKTDNVTTLMFATGRPPSTWFSLKERALEQCNELFQYAKVSRGRLRVVTSQTELKKYLKDRRENPNQTAGFLGVEGMQILEGDLNNVQVMYDAGIRMMAPTHFFDNKLGGSAHGINKGGLTPFGREVIKKMESLHMTVDLAHASPALIDDVLDYSGDNQDTGKNLGDDLAEGKPTLPLIYAMQAGTAEQANLIRKAIEEGGTDGFQPVLDIIQQTAALDYARKCAQAEIETAIAAISCLQESEYKECLMQLASFAVTRNY